MSPAFAAGEFVDANAMLIFERKQLLKARATMKPHKINKENNYDRDCTWVTVQFTIMRNRSVIETFHVYFDGTLFVWPKGYLISANTQIVGLYN